ncbi:hypothetical protein ABTL46_22310, partial [Acinetobacter baumannii]
MSETVTDTAEAISDAKARPEKDSEKAAPKAKKKLDTKSVAPRIFPVEVDHSRDALLTEFGKETLKDRYL